MERWGWQLTIGSLALMSVGHVGAYWLAFVNADCPVILLGMLIGVFGNVLLGLALIRSGFRPRLAAWVILLDLPLSIALVEMSTQALGMWPMMLAWGLVGWSLWRDETVVEAPGADTSGRRPAQDRAEAPQ